MTSLLGPIGRLSDRSRRRAAWGVPLVVAGAIALTATVASGSASGASPDLPARTAAQLLTAVQTSSAHALSGEVSTTANLGIPELPGATRGASLSWQDFISGTHRARVWVDGPQKQRVALIGELSEADVVHNGTDLWTYTSDTNTVTHTTLPSRAAGSTANDAQPDARDLTPAAAAQRVLSAIDPSTAVHVDATRTVAGRAAYTLELAPRDSNSTVARVTIAIDSATSVPLQVQVFASGSSPAFSSGFTSVHFGAPAASVFAFRSPAGATVAKDPFGSSSGGRDAHTHRPAKQQGRDVPAARPRVIGSGWTAVLVLPAPASGASSTTAHLPDELTTAVGTNGERLLHTALVNAVLLPDGRTFVGAVDAAYLEHLAATTR